MNKNNVNDLESKAELILKSKTTEELETMLSTTNRLILVTIENDMLKAFEKVKARIENEINSRGNK